jgi:spore coat polysaccharide biosynthesis protein SpsF (cytidylyltransferase family)
MRQRPGGDRRIAIIQARMASERLPGKVLLDIAGQSMLERVVRRVQRCETIDEAIVATSLNPADDAIVSEADRLGVGVERGSELDVLDRFHQVAELHPATVYVRVGADSPFIDPAVCDLVVRRFADATPDVDYASNKIRPSFPLGLDVEAFSRAALDRAWRRAKQDYERSHVTIYMYQHPADFRLLSVEDDADRHSWRWTVDTTEDLQFAREAFARLGGSNNFSWLDVVRLIEDEPSLAAINARSRARDVSDG